MQLNFNLMSSLVTGKHCFMLKRCLVTILLTVHFIVFVNSYAYSASVYNESDSSETDSSELLMQKHQQASKLWTLAKVALRVGNLEEAENHILQALAINPDNAVMQFDAARIMSHQAMQASIFSLAGYAKKALNSYKKAVRLNPDVVRYRQSLMRFYLKAPSMLGGDMKLAKEESRAIAKLDEVQGMLAQVDINHELEQESEAQAVYDKALRKFPGNSHVYMHRGKHYQSLERYDLALADFEQVLQSHSSKSNLLKLKALYEIGHNSVLSQNNVEQGISVLRVFIKEFNDDDRLPTLPWAKFRLAQLLIKTGELDEAREILNEVKSKTEDKSLLKEMKSASRKL